MLGHTMGSYRALHPVSGRTKPGCGSVVGGRGKVRTALVGTLRDSNPETTVWRCVRVWQI